MLRSDLIRRVVEAIPGLREQDGQEVVSAVLETITIALKRGHRVEIRGLGSFRVKKYPAWDGRNPKTGVYVAVPETRAIMFRPGREIRRRLADIERPQGS